ncbi:hypothetical protein EMGBD4_15950 [Verrucomicrobiota bacterium]|nr:hypothetical protein EMGBD4_15950 [Verrucomicrobiota bacterium]
MRDLSQAEAGLSGALGKLMVVSEQYPQLKADTTMRALMEELTSTEKPHRVLAPSLQRRRLIL